MKLRRISFCFSIFANSEINMDIKKLSLLELNREQPDEFIKKPKISVFLVADHIRSGHNLGSLFRIADAFAFSKIYICGYEIDIHHTEIRKSAIGAEKTVSWEYFKNTQLCLEKLRNENVTILGLEQTNRSIPLQELIIDPKQTYALVLGNEIDGISEAALPWINQFVEIPQWGTKHSLNVSVAAGIFSWELVKKLKF